MAVSLGSRPARRRLYRAGRIFRCARSPVAPKITATQGSGIRSRRVPTRSGLVSGAASSAPGGDSSWIAWRGATAEAPAEVALRVATRVLATVRSALRLHGVAAELVAK